MTDEKEAPQAGNQSSGSSIADAFQKLDPQDRIVLYGTAGAFFFGFLPWYSISVFGVSHTTAGFAPWHGKIYFLSCLAITCLLLLPALRQQLFEKLSPGLRTLTIPVLAAATLIFGPVFFMMGSGQAFAGSEETDGLMSGGKTMWFFLSFLATAAAAGSAGWKWKQSAVLP